MSENNIYGLVCSGGGARGSYQVGVLKYIHENFCHDNHSPFQIFTGASCGSLNTSFYAAHSYDARQSRLKLEDLWLHFHVPAYHAGVVKIMLRSVFHRWKHHKRPDAQAVWSLLNPGPMKEIIHKGFLRENLDKSFKEKSTLGMGIAATEMLSGRCCWFQEGEKASEWNLIHSLGIKTRLEPHHLEASCSVPVFLPPVKIEGRYFLDGAVGLDRPVAAAVIMGATRILTIATDQPLQAELPQYPEHFKPRVSNVIRLLLNRLSRDLTHQEGVEIRMLNRFHDAISDRKKNNAEKEAFPLFHDQAMPSHYQPVELFAFYPSKNIRDYFGIDKRGEKKSRRTQFLFHSKFIQELIDLGYQDAKARHEELSNFFVPEIKKRWFFYPKEKTA